MLKRQPVYPHTMYSAFLVVVFVFAGVSRCADRQLKCINFASSTDNDVHSRFVRSAEFAQVDVKSVLIGDFVSEEVKDGDASSGTCQKENCENAKSSEISALSIELSAIEDDDSIVMVTHGVDNDVILSEKKDLILARFEAFEGGDILFASDRYCSHVDELCKRFPVVERGGQRFLNAGVIIARVSKLLKLLTENQHQYAGDYQLFFSQVYVDKSARQQYGMVIDHSCHVLQSMNGVATTVDLRFRGEKAFVQNTAFSTDPAVVFGDRSSRLHVNALGNYLAGAWSPTEGCRHCWLYQIELGKDPTKFPTLLMAVFVETATPFFAEFIEQMTSIIYPKKKIHLFIHNNVEYHDKAIANLRERFLAAYASFTVISHEDEVSEVDARQRAVAESLKHDVDFMFSIDSTVQIDNAYILKLLIEQNVDVLSPLLVKPYTNIANFWGSLSEDGSYAESGDYQEIVEGRARGLWNVPVITSCYLIKKSILQNQSTRPNYVLNDLNPQLAFAANMRKTGKVLYTTNRVSLGHLVSTDNFQTGRLFDELWQLEQNRWDWEKRYLHANYSMALHTDSVNEQPCPDVFWFPLASELFCQQLIDTMENFGQWSSGTNDDPRLEGGYESVPTRDIHMKQIEYEDIWLMVLRDYVRPLQEKVFPGYHSDPLQSLLNFVVRYRPDEQPSLRPHHDTSTYTINIALNTPGIDYQGGGCRFLRYNCSVTDSRRGWMLMHPGRLSHYHEGLPTTDGTRYIMISFIDP